MTFTMWSLGHYLYLVSPFIAIPILVILTKNRSEETKTKVGIILSLFAILLLVLRNLEIWVNGSFAFNYELIPLQVCHFANIVLLIAFLTKKQMWFNLSLTLNLPAAFVSILFANSLTHYSTILSFRGIAYILGHALLVIIPVWAFAVGFIKLDLKSLVKTFKLVASLYVVSIFINNFIGIVSGSYSNYFYSIRPESGTPLEMFFNWGNNLFLFDVFQLNIIYLIMTALFGGVVMGTLYLLFYSFQQHSLKKASQA